jgi:hypothetical protein
MSQAELDLRVRAIPPLPPKGERTEVRGLKPRTSKAEASP